MAGAFTAYGLSALAGVLSTLSPCVLPLVPILMGSALSAHRLGPAALAGGIALSFTAVGIAIARLGAAIGLDGDVVRPFGAVLLLAIGVVLMSEALQQRFATLMGRVTGGGHLLLSRVTLDGVAGQFVLGLVLGIVWTPCVGPTLGAAVTLASQRSNLAGAAVQMAVFGLGASVPMLLIGSASQAALGRSKGLLRVASRRGKQFLGVVLVGLGALIITHADRGVEAWLVGASPDWLTALTTRF